jgi:6-pyruvoyltetrahydropterin/6-carboxytetrahydropterin synthase
MIRLTRRYAFSAAHVLARPDWDAERNRSTYGKCANPAGHGHNYLLEVTVSGEVDPRSGRVLLPEILDRTVRERVLRHVGGRFLNRELEAFRERVPTAENIARFAWEALEGQVEPAALDSVRLEETAKNSVELSREVAEAGAEEECERWHESKA